jgi:hypothetical protein
VTGIFPIRKKPTLFSQGGGVFVYLGMRGPCYAEREGTMNIPPTKTYGMLFFAAGFSAIASGILASSGLMSRDLAQALSVQSVGTGTIPAL